MSEHVCERCERPATSALRDSDGCMRRLCGCHRQLDDATAELARLRAALAGRDEMLRAVEWRNNGRCLFCLGCPEEGHALDCRYVRLDPPLTPPPEPSPAPPGPSPEAPTGP